MTRPLTWLLILVFVAPISAAQLPRRTPGLTDTPSWQGTPQMSHEDYAPRARTGAGIYFAGPMGQELMVRWDTLEQCEQALAQAKAGPLYTCQALAK